MNHPISTTYLDVQAARASAALPAAGAFDAAPLQLPCPGFYYVTLYIEYTRGAAGGAVTVRPEVSENSGGTAWHQVSLYTPVANVPNTDTLSTLQREAVEYGSTGAAIERFVLSLFLGGNVELLRVPCAESGVIANPGTCAIRAHFSMAMGA